MSLVQLSVRTFYPIFRKDLLIFVYAILPKAVLEQGKTEDKFLCQQHHECVRDLEADGCSLQILLLFVEAAETEETNTI